MTTVSLERGGIRDGFPADLTQSNRNGQRGRAQVWERLERATQHLAGRRKLVIPGPINKSADLGNTLTYHLRAPRESYSASARMVGYYTTGISTDQVTIRVTTPFGLTEEILPGSALATSPEPFDFNFQFGAGLRTDYALVDLDVEAFVTRPSVSNPNTPTFTLWNWRMIVESMAAVEI